MINLKDMIAHASKYLNRIMIEIEPSSVIELCERVMAAEGLAEARRRGGENLARELVLAEKEIAELKVQRMLATAKPAAQMCPQPIYPSEIHSGSQVKINWGDVNTPTTADTVAAEQPDSSPKQRITEQDAREIAFAFLKVRNKYTSAQSSDLFSGWINTGDGRTLLAKLNEHR